MSTMPHYVLEGMTSNPRTGVVALVRNVDLVLEREERSVMRASMVRKINSNIHKFYPDAGGILMGFKDIKMKRIKSEDASTLLPIHIRAKFYVFKLTAGMELVCEVTQQEAGSLKCKAHGVFQVEVNSLSESADMVFVGQSVIIKVDAVEQMAWQEPKILGSLVEVSGDSGGNPFIAIVENFDSTDNEFEIETDSGLIEQLSRGGTRLDDSLRKQVCEEEGDSSRGPEEKMVLETPPSQGEPRASANSFDNKNNSKKRTSPAGKISSPAKKKTKKASEESLSNGDLVGVEDFMRDGGGSNMEVSDNGEGGVDSTISSDHQDKNISKNCSLCDYSTHDKWVLKYHMESKHHNLRYKCSMCNKHYTKKSSLIVHIKKVHTKALSLSPIKCSLPLGGSGETGIGEGLPVSEEAVCASSKEQGDSDHRDDMGNGGMDGEGDVHDGMNLEGVKLLYANSEKQREVIKKHQKVKTRTSNESEIKSTKKKFPCDSCNYIATQIGNLYRHKKIIHKINVIKKQKEIRSLECDQCKFIAPSKSKMNLHRRKHNLTVKTKSEFPCDQCGYKAYQKVHLNRHLVRIHGLDLKGFTYPCNFCNFCASDRYNLENHIKITHEKLRLICKICENKFTKKSSLKYHMAVKHGIVPPNQQGNQMENIKFCADSKMGDKKPGGVEANLNQGAAEGMMGEAKSCQGADGKLGVNPGGDKAKLLLGAEDMMVNKSGVFENMLCEVTGEPK